MRLILEEQQKYLQSFINNATYHPMNPDADVTYQTVNLFISDKCFIYFISDLHITFDEISTTLYSPGKGTCTWYMRSNDMFIFLESHFRYFFKIENAVHTSFQNSMLSFIDGLIFDIMNIQNNQSFEFKWIPMLAPLRSVNDQTFSLLRLCFP